MKRVDNLLKHPRFQQELNRIEQLERTRIYCHHDFEHLLAVARIAWIIVLEKKSSVPKPIVYGTALLHDIGRGMEYKTGISHDEASVQIAKEILPDCGFKEAEIQDICDAILGHRHENQKDMKSDLQQILKEADWRSRLCFQCKAEKTCKWSQQRKNQSIFY